MPSTLPVVLILGSGPNIGHHVARTFAAKGYKVALASRKMKEEESTTEQLNVSSDLSDPGSVGSVFSKVSATLGHPSVVVYNAGAVTFNDPKNPFSVPLEDFKRTLSVNTLSPFVAAQQAVLGFERLPDSAAKTFIFTGNITNTITIANLVDQGAGKSATAHIIQAASTAYSDRGFKFYYVDERTADGSPAYSKVDGEAHGQHYLHLAESKTQKPWQQTFVKGIGYKDFSSK